MHFPVSLRNVSPTAMGLTSCRVPSLLLFRAISLPPAKKVDTDIGTFPEARRFTTSLREEPMEVWRGTDAASSRCWTESPEGPADVPLGKDLKTGRMGKAGLSVMGSEVTFGATGGGQDGCLPFSKCHVVSVFGATPLDRSIWQALPVIPERPSETAELITFL